EATHMTRTSTVLTLLLVLACASALAQAPCNLTVQPANNIFAIKTAFTVNVKSTCTLDQATFDLLPGPTTPNTQQLGTLAANQVRAVTYTTDTTGTATFRLSGFPSGCISCAQVQASSSPVTFVQFTAASLSPTGGTAAGGAKVTITGANFDD